MWAEERKVVMSTSGGRGAPMGKAIWQWNGDRWILKTIQSDNGGIAGDPPRLPGRFKGQLRATPCAQPVVV